MKSIKTMHTAMLIITALIWGVAFVAQSSGGDAAGPLTFNSIRSLIGGIVLLPVIALLDKINLTAKRPSTKKEWKTLIKGGVICGILLFLATTSQQLGISGGTSAGKAGFITACYIIIVPIFGILINKKCGWNIWVGVVLTIAGLYLLCISETLSLNLSDMLVLFGACIFAIHILTIDFFSPLVDGVRMSCIQFFTCGILGIFPMFFVEMNHSISGIVAWAPRLASWSAWLPILYAGIMSCGVAYTLQIVGQNGINPTVASLILSLESVFSALAGWMILHEKLGAKELLGCVIIFIAITLAHIPFNKIQDGTN